MIAVEDIGKWVGFAFSDPEKYLGNAIEIAGDELTYEEIQSAWKKLKGKSQFCLRLPSFLISMMGEAGTMFLWFGTHGYKANINACKEQYGGMLTFEQWLAKANK
jgi:hypothetical protein